jgi:hypothetical protein
LPREGTVEDYYAVIDDKMITCYHNTKNHKYDIFVDGDAITFSKAKGEAVIRFLKFMVQSSEEG